MNTATVLALAVSAGTGLMAQQPSKVPMPPGAQTYYFERSTFEFQDNTVVKGAPYSATAVSSSNQTLGDGTHIARSSQAMLARDADGRTRREQGVQSVGPWTAESEQHIVSISDPVAQARYTLFPDRQMAVRINMPSREQMTADVKKRLAEELHSQSAAAEAGTARVVHDKIPGEPGNVGYSVHIGSGAGFGGGVGFSTGAGGMISVNTATGPITVVGTYMRDSTKAEDLGEKMFEGVKAKGRRESQTIPVGEIGNDRPIEMTSEVWYSDELQTVVYSKRSDPRMGDTEFKLTNITRGDQPRNLFEVPAGYTLREEGRQRE